MKRNTLRSDNYTITIYQRGRKVGEAEDIAYSETREMTPIYVMNGEEAISFGKGMRGIAGNIIFSYLSDDFEIDKFNCRITVKEFALMPRSMCITGMEIINEGESVSREDIVIGKQNTWVGSDIIPWNKEKR